MVVRTVIDRIMARTVAARVKASVCADYLLCTALLIMPKRLDATARESIKENRRSMLFEISNCN